MIKQETSDRSMENFSKSFGILKGSRTGNSQNSQLDWKWWMSRLLPPTYTLSPWQFGHFVKLKHIHTFPTLLHEKMSNSCEQLSRNMSLQRIPCWAINFWSEPNIDTATTWPNRHVPVPWELDHVCLLTLMFRFWFLHCESRLVSYLDWATRQKIHVPLSWAKVTRFRWNSS